LKLDASTTLTDTAAASHRRPLAVPLLIRRDIEVLKLQAARRDIATAGSAAPEP
jgi:hypothetical protein